MDIYSNEDGVILYDLYRYEDDDQNDKNFAWKVVGGVVIIGIAAGVIIILSAGSATPAAAAIVLPLAA